MFPNCPNCQEVKPCVSSSFPMMVPCVYSHLRLYLVIFKIYVRCLLVRY